MFLYAELNRRVSSWPKRDNDIIPSFDSELTDQEVCFPGNFKVNYHHFNFPPFSLPGWLAARMATIFSKLVSTRGLSDRKW